MPRSPAAFAFAALLLAVAASGAETPTPLPAAPPPELAWAYPAGTNKAFPPLKPGPQRVPGSRYSFTAAQAQDDQNPPDWFPDEHPPAPAVVAHGTPDGRTPCAECHLFNGQGFLAAPSLAGLSPAYSAEQVREFASGRRRSTEHDRPDTREMIATAARTSDAEAATAAAWFAALPRRAWFRVVETATVPVTRAHYYGWVDRVPGTATEPIAGRIVELPEDEARTFLSDPHSGLVAYVPPGSIARGAALVASGGGSGQPCAACHGDDLRGTGDVPPLAGRSPAYLARMLWDIGSGARGGPTVDLMQAPAAGLGPAEITDVAAYLASRAP